MDENKEAVERTYGGIASLLLTVERALKDWEGRDAPKDKEPIEEFERLGYSLERRTLTDLLWATG